METSANLQPSVGPGFRVHERYRVIRVIESGGMGAVYEAVDERLGSRVALKESYAQEDPELERQFEREARLLASLKHPALPRVTDYFIESDHAFLVMEYIEGDSLAEVITKQAPLPAQRVIAWADQVLDVLIYLHGTARGIVHRDIKPHNLRVTSNGVISLLDFGLAKMTQSASSDTEARSVHGYTRWYSPIEQIENSGNKRAQRHLCVRRDALSLAHRSVRMTQRSAREASRQRESTVCIGLTGLCLPLVRIWGQSSTSYGDTKR